MQNQRQSIVWACLTALILARQYTPCQSVSPVDPNRPPPECSDYRAGGNQSIQSALDCWESCIEQGCSEYWWSTTTLTQFRQCQCNYCSNDDDTYGSTYSFVICETDRTYGYVALTVVVCVVVFALCVGLCVYCMKFRRAKSPARPQRVPSSDITAEQSMYLQPPAPSTHIAVSDPNEPHAWELPPLAGKPPMYAQPPITDTHRGSSPYVTTNAKSVRSQYSKGEAHVILVAEEEQAMIVSTNGECSPRRPTV